MTSRPTTRTTATTQKSPTRPRWVVPVAIALVALLAFGTTAFFLRGSSDPAPTAPAGPAAAANSHVLDDAGPGAPTLVEFLDFECGACASLHPVVKELRAKHQGRLNYVVRYFPLPNHPNSLAAALAVEAAAQQGRFEDMMGLMFSTQSQWAGQQDSQAGRFRSYAEQLGLDLAAYDKTLADPATGRRVQQDFDDGRALGLTGTPTFFLNDTALDLRRITDLADAVDAAVAGASTGAAGTGASS